VERQYYVVGEEEDVFGESKIVAVHVTNADYYDANGHQSDWTDEGVIETVGQGGEWQAGELMEGVIEVGGATKEAVEAHLKTLSEFEFSQDFSDFIDQFANLDC
jgi:hypothetical protein